MTEQLKQMIDGSKNGTMFITMADIYRKARYMWQLQDYKFGNGIDIAPDHDSIRNAVNVARWMPATPALLQTVYGTVTLVWKNNSNYLSMEFFPHKVKVFKLINKEYNNACEITQNFEKQIPIDILFLSLVQFAAEIGSPINQELRAWDNYEGIDIPDLNMSEIEEREQKILKQLEEQLDKQEAQKQEEEDNSEEVFSTTETKNDFTTEI